MSKVTNQSYFIKRLKDSGYVVYKMFDEYVEADNRSWTILIDPHGAAIYCTCFVNGGPFGDETYFEFHDGGRFLPSYFKLRTESMEVIIGYLVQFNINNKAENYGK